MLSDSAPKSRADRSVDNSQDWILRFKNDPYSNYVVTVDMLTTGVDVPSICNLVSLRRIRSRILHDQMIGRATRLCPEIGKQYFRIFDAVDLYAELQEMSEMRPVVVIEAKLSECERFYNFTRPQSAFNEKTPYEALRRKL